MPHLLLIPGLGSDDAVWARTITALDGRVDCTVGNTFLDDDIAGMAKRILAKAPPNFTLAGVSMGGMVALEIMRVAPHRVRGLALIGTRARPDTEEQAARRRYINTAVLAAPNLWALSEASLDQLVHPSTPGDVRRELVEMGVRVGAETYVRQNKAILARPDQRNILSAISVRTQIIVGEADLMSPPACALEIHEAVSGSEMHILPGCGHLPPIEAPTVTAQLLEVLLT